MLEEFWAQAVYHLRLSSEQFWLLTPRQFHLLFDCHRASLSHREMLHAFTTVAVLNTSPYPRDEAAIALHYMPNHPQFMGASGPAARAALAAKVSPERAAEHSALQGKVAKLAAELAAGEGEMLDRIRRGERSI